VLYINFEIPRAFIKQRLQIIAAKTSQPIPENLHIWTLRGQSMDFDTLLQAVQDQIKTHPYTLIILDPIYKLMVGSSENTGSGAGILCHNIERLAESTGAAVIYAHHFTKGNAARKKAIDRMSGSGVFARDADTIITMTEHQEEGCYAVEMTLRNLPPQDSFVVKWDYPVMVSREDLNPADLKENERDQSLNDLEPLLKLLDEKALTVGDWEKAAKNEGYSRATFYRMKKKLELEKRVQFNQKDKTCSREPEEKAQVEGSVPNHNETGETFETGETIETFETTEAADGNKLVGGQIIKPSAAIDHPVNEKQN
jgi:hypothetical protein